MKLLAPPPPAELPAEALLARLRCRRAALARGAGADPTVTHAWLLPRLDRRLRRVLTPYLEVMAMRTLGLALRHRLAGVSPPATLLHQPWLAAELAPLVEAPGESRVVVARVEQALAVDYPFVRGMVGDFRNQGPGAVETRLTEGMLGQALALAQDPAVRLTVRCFIDLRNLLAVLRHWRWQLRQPPPLLPGGEIAPPRLRKAWAGNDRHAFTGLAARLGTGGPIDFEPRAAERQLLAGLGERIRQAGRDPLGTGVVLDTLWRGTMAARYHPLRDGSELTGDWPSEVLA